MAVRWENVSEENRPVQEWAVQKRCQMCCNSQWLQVRFFLHFLTSCQMTLWSHFISHVFFHCYLDADATARKVMKERTVAHRLITARRNHARMMERVCRQEVDTGSSSVAQFKCRFSSFLCSRLLCCQTTHCFCFTNSIQMQVQERIQGEAVPRQCQHVQDTAVQKRCPVCAVQRRKIQVGRKSRLPSPKYKFADAWGQCLKIRTILQV